MDGAAVLLRLLATIVLTAALSGAATTANASSVRTAVLPGVVHRGQAVKISVATAAKNVCLAQVRYADGAVQESGIKRPVNRRVTWTIRIPNNAMLGLAHWSVRCGVLFQRSGNWRVAAAIAGVDTTPHVLIDKEGFTQRPDKLGTGSTVSYGLLLKNTSLKEDAQNVYLLISFATESGELIGTKTTSVPLIPAGETYAYGDAILMRTQAVVTKLEVTIRVNAHTPTKGRVLPHFVNVEIVPNTIDPGWVGEVDGEIVNDTSPQTLTSAKLSVVVLNAAGAIVGGGTGFSFSPLPSGSRMVFLARNGFKAIPVDQAVTPIISVDPTYSSG
jgi:hypothetical protein